MKTMIQSLRSGLICLTFAGISPAFSQSITTASDNGANYGSGWNSGSNGGTGFQPWNIWSSGGTGGFGGNFVGNPAAAGIAGMAAQSFALYAKQSSGAYANAERRLNNSLGVGQTLSFQWSINWDCASGVDGGKGYDIYSGNSKILTINNGGNSDITCNGTNVGFAYGTNPMTWSFTRLNSTTISVSANGRNGTDSFATNVVVTDGAIDRLIFYAYNMQDGDNRQPYFNNLTVTEPAATSMAVPGDHAFLGAWSPDGSNGTGMTKSTDAATPNLWTSYFKSSDARQISCKFAANGTFDFSWGADPSRPGYAKRGADPIKLTIPATGLYKFTFDQASLQYSLVRATSTDFGTYQQFADTYGVGAESADDDSDGLTNGQEYVLLTDPSNRDSDGDSLLDGFEVNTSSTNPLAADSDNDTLPDWWEVAQGLNPNSSVGPDGAAGDPDGDGFTNKQEFDGQSNPKLASSVPANRAVTFSLDLNRQISATNNPFVTNGAAVEVWGTFNDWGNLTNKYSLTNNGSGIYSGTFTVPGAGGSTNRYKFVTFNSSNTLTWEPGSDRVLVMGSNGVATNLALAYLGEVRPVTFSVNMGVQSQLGNFTVGGTNKVFVVGADISGGWDPGTELTQVGSTEVYAGTAWVSGQQGTTSNFKFRGGNGLSYEDGTLLGSDTRVLTLGARDLPQTNAEVYFNNSSGLRVVSFAVNMNVQTNTNKLSFNPTTDTVEVRGTFNSFGGGTNWRLTNNGSGIFTGSFTVPGVDGVTNGFKYVALIGANAAFERVDISRTNSLLNRTLVLGPTGTPQTAHSVESPAFFGLDDGVGPVITRSGPATVNLNAGDSYTDEGATASDVIEGACTVNVSVSPSGTLATITQNPGTYTITYSASDAAGNAGTPVTRTVVVAAAGSTFAAWSGGAALNQENVTKYAIGGASSLTANDGQSKTVLVSSTQLSLTDIVRVDDSKLTVVGEAVTSLNDYAPGGTVAPVNGVDAADQTGVPAGHKRKTFTVSRGSDERKFLRLKATLNP